MCLGAPLPWQRAGDHQFLPVNIWGANLESLSSPLGEKKKDLVNTECFSTRRPCVRIMSHEFTRTLICQGCGWQSRRVSFSCSCSLVYLWSAVTIMQLWLEAYRSPGTPCITPRTCDSHSRAVKQTSPTAPSCVFEVHAPDCFFLFSWICWLSGCRTEQTIYVQKWQIYVQIKA